MSAHQATIGEWYRMRGGELFEVVAIDEEDGTIEIQYFDGTLEELDVEDWQTEASAGGIEKAEAPEDWSGSVDIEPEDERNDGSGVEEERRLNAGRLEGLDLFE